MLPPDETDLPHTEKFVKIKQNLQMTLELTTGPARLGDQVYQQILDRIIKGEFPRGSRLPTQARLAAMFGVSRPIIREALMRLSDDGFVRSRQGSGSFVQDLPRPEILHFAPIGSIADVNRCFEFRYRLEGEAAELAAQRRSDTMLSEMEAALARMDRSKMANQSNVEADYLFHLIIARATQNKYFETTMELLKEPAVLAISLTQNLMRPRPHERLEVKAEHLDILAAIRHQQPAAAKAAMRSHIERAQARLISGS